ncbi:hypothetical protein N9C66_05195 [Akkermansiaceae bacterium]|nr:hypothetical protein [Akkermansiaceae bacterium]MDA9830717.1 hypothetical protein [Akkermansiaceae bacterium]MDB4488916.1 hypothetical protein [Akkermansiaceae bacterium]
MRTTEDLLIECMERGEIPQAIALLLHLHERAMLSKIPDPKTARTKTPDLDGDELCLFEAAVESFLRKEMTTGTVLDILVKDAFARNDRRAFEIIQKACDYAGRPHQIKHGRNVIAAIEATIEILEKQRRFPSKYEVKAAVNQKLKLNAFDEDEAQPWTKVFKDAYLRFLPKSNPGSVKTAESGK